MITFHFCESFIKNSKGKDFEEVLLKKLSEISNRDSLKNINSISCISGVYIFKTSKPKTRTIIEEQNILIEEKEVKVFFVRDVISNNNFDYDYVKVLVPQLRNRTWLRNNPLPLEDKNNFITKQINERKITEKKLQYPPVEKTKWLDDFNIRLDNDIFETEDWVRYTLNNSSLEGMEDNYVHTFRIVLKEVIDLDSGTVIKHEKGIEIKEYNNQNIGILYFKLKVSQTKTIFLLLYGARIQKQKAYWEQSKSKLLSQEIDFEPNEDSISRKAFRSYPKWTLNDEDLWFNIQKSKEDSNLSLTREQIEFFNDFKFPRYINGQAGSGKSTMLYYIYANAYYYKCLDEINGEIIFLTENEILLKHTQDCVYDLLTNNSYFSGLTPEQIEKSKKNFNSFKKFLLEIISEDERDKFPENKYLDFSKFKYLYESSNIPTHILEKYSAEEVWFTISTYIYGYSLETKISYNNFHDIIPRDLKIIPIDKFKGIETSVLKFYEKLINEEGYWDKLKLIKYIDQNIHIKEKYSVIICDEAQDFSRVELQFILRMSEFLEFDLSTTKQVPIVFAGDPNQTVNPTGFRQSQMTSMLYEELKEIAKFDYNTEDNVYNPTFNYRSSQPVVSLSNFIQYHRMKKLGIIQARLQEAKRPSIDSHKINNVFLDYNEIEENIELKKDLIEKLKYKIFIIPVNSYEKEDFINRHKLLSQISKAEVKTSVESKGAEYEQVVLYGFGEYFIDNLKTVSKDKPDIDELFRKSYFYNKLYVGITRAQTELLIIDSREAKENFWKTLLNNLEISDNNWIELNKIKNDIILYNPGSIKDRIADSNENNALKNAEQDKKQGLYDKNSARLKVAANQFNKIGNTEEYYECLALAEEIKENWLGAAEYFIFSPSPNYEKASHCFFTGRYFKELESKIGSNLRSNEQDIRLAISRLMRNEILGLKEINIFNQNVAKLYEITNRLDWRQDIINQFITASKKIELIEYKKDFVQVLEKIAKSTDYDLWKEIGRIWYDLKDYKNAIDAWDTIEYFDNNEKYSRAQIELSKQNKDVEKTIIWLDDLIKYLEHDEIPQTLSKIVDAFTQSSKETIQFSNYCLKIIFKAIIILQKQCDELIRIIQIIETNHQSNISELTNYFHSLINNSIKNKNLIVFIIERWAKSIWKSNYSTPNKDWLDRLNATYLDFTKKLNILYKEFVFEELENMPNIADHITLKPNLQFDNFRIINFRRFQDLSVNHLGLYNLIVGDNNVGKTSLLESLLFDTRKEYFIQNLAYAHIHRNNLPVRHIDGQDKYSISTNFIADYIRKDAILGEMKFMLTENRNEWNYKIKTSQKSEIIEKFQNLPNIDTAEFLTFVTDNLDFNLVELPIILKNTNPIDNIRSPFIPFGKGFGKDLASTYYSEIDIYRDKRSLFLENMKIFIPKIQRINVNTEIGAIDIEEEGFEKSAPLHQYGEGANKLFRVLVQLTLQKNNKILIDEIDAGIHYSHFSDFWKTILTIAQRNNVQVFATTHNIECVKHFSNILKENDFVQFQQESKIITLRELPEGRIKAYTRSFNEFEYELENEFEIRGGDL
ncbi:MAG: AAA family ATPase [Candidatus Delongbacteria bacterium]|nr:AAA family ATPase [Candidatus Delongbacteria bacterium]